MKIKFVNRSWVIMVQYGAPLSLRAMAFGFTAANFRSNPQSFSRIRVSTMPWLSLVALIFSLTLSHRICHRRRLAQRWTFSPFGVQTKTMWLASVGLSTVLTYLRARCLHREPDLQRISMLERWTMWLASRRRFYCCCFAAWLNWSSLFCDWIHRSGNHAGTCVEWCSGRGVQQAFGSCVDTLPNNTHTVD